MGTQRKVLLVDDEMGIRALLSEVLSDKGFDVRVAKDGLESLDELERDNFDLVITDINMPRLDGISMLKVMKQEGRKEKVIIMTGAALNRNTINKDFPEVVTRLEKPFKIDMFLDVVANAMANQQDAAARL